MSKHTKKLALCGMLAALSVAVMMLGTLIPLATYCCPVLASLVLLIVREECGAMAWGVWAVTAVLSALLAPDKEAAALFVFIGYYPVLKPILENVRVKPLQLLIKFAIFNLSIGVMYALLLWVFHLESLTQEPVTQVMTIVLVLLGNATFFVYDFLLVRLGALYRVRLQKTIRKIF